MMHVTEHYDMEMAVKPSDPCPQMGDEEVQLSCGICPADTQRL